MDFDLDMEFVPNMELYKDDSDDDFVCEEIIKKDLKKLIDCEICENPNSKKIKYRTDSFNKEINLCTKCNTHYSHIIKTKLMKMLKQMNIKIYPLKRITDVIRNIIQNSKDLDKTFVQINDIFNETFIKYKNELENNIPFDNIKILDYNDTFFCYTTETRMNKFIKKNLVHVISDKVIKWNYVATKNYTKFQITEEKMKQNKCLICENTKYISSMSIFTNKKNLSKFFKDNILIHFFFAVCSKCRDNCEKNVLICNNYFKDILDTECDKYIEKIHDEKKDNDILLFIDKYIEKFKDFVSESV